MPFKPFHFLFLLICIIPVLSIGQPESEERPAITIKKTGDFEISGDGSADNWNETEWINLTQRNNKKNNDLIDF